MAFFRVVDRDENEHFINVDAIVNVRSTISGGSFIDVNGLESSIFVHQKAREVVDMLLTSELLDRAPKPGDD